MDDQFLSFVLGVAEQLVRTRHPPRIAEDAQQDARGWLDRYHLEAFRELLRLYEADAECQELWSTIRTAKPGEPSPSVVAAVALLRARMHQRRCQAS